MPSEYSTSHSIDDAKALAENLGIEMLQIPIERSFHAYLESIIETLGDSATGLAEENLQARIRGNLLMFISNRYGHLVVATGNKSEMACGYATLYGDMAGGFALLKDVFKTEVYAISRYRNSISAVIPENILTKPPSAELRPGQKDSDSLPPYDVLDPILEAYIEHDRSHLSDRDLRIRRRHGSAGRRPGRQGRIQTSAGSAGAEGDHESLRPRSATPDNESLEGQGPGGGPAILYGRATGRIGEHRPMALTLLLLSDGYQDVRDLLPELPMTPFALRRAPLKSTVPQDLIALHPDLLLIDGTGDADAAEEATRTMALAWEIGLPPLIVIVDAATLSRFRFETGADDFLLTTASSDEIAARFALAARRAGQGDAPTVLKVGDLTVNPDNYQVYVHGKPLDLTYKEFELLRFLAQRPGRVCDRDLLLREVWGYDYYGGTRTVDVHVRRLRAKLGPEHEALIETIRNVGYRLVPRPRER